MLEIENEEETYKVKYEFRLEFAYQRNKDKTVLKQHTLKVSYPRFPQIQPCKNELTVQNSQCSLAFKRQNKQIQETSALNKDRQTCRIIGQRL